MPAGKPKPVPFDIFQVEVIPRVFNPTVGEMVTISCRMSRPGKSILKIYDPKMYLVKEMAIRDFQNLGKLEFNWNGRDSRGNIVPDEAYFFTIEAFDLKKGFTKYDPTSSTMEHQPNLEIKYDQQRKLLKYELIRDARIKVRAGIFKGGPLLKNILNWKPKLAGRYEERWDGKDESGTVTVTGQQNFGISAQTLTLPENSIIAVGNDRYPYIDYFRKNASNRPKKTRITPSIISKTEWLGLPLRVPDPDAIIPKFFIELAGNHTKNKQGLPIVKGEVPVVIRLDQKNKKYVLEQRFEILCYVDFKFVREVEEGYSPARWILGTTIYPNGEHILTVNVATFSGQVYSSSMKIHVRN